MVNRRIVTIGRTGLVVVRGGTIAFVPVRVRSSGGEGNFNWRFVFDFNYLNMEEKIIEEKKESLFQVGNTIRKIPPRVIIRLYDADLLSADDFLGECILNLTHVPLGEKTAKECKADLVLPSKHRALNLFVSVHSSLVQTGGQ